jgi:hypothetical protein
LAISTKPFLQWEVRWPRKIATPGEAVRYLDAIGFCMLFPIKNLPLPSLYYAVSRCDQPNWDRYAQKIWRWKDELPRRRRGFYAKYIRGRGTFLSLKMLPSFLAVEGSAVAPGDHARLYSAGLIGYDARALLEALEKHGPLATLELRHACRMGTTAGNVRFKRAALELQRRLLAVHSGAEQETRGWVSTRLELVCRAFSRETSAARRISPESGQAAIAAKYFEWHPEATPALLARLFGWSRTDAAAAVPSPVKE